MSIDLQRAGAWTRVHAPTAEHPYWHEEDGTRLHFLDVCHGDVTVVRDLHASAVGELMHAAFTARDTGMHAESRRLIAAASRLCEEAAGLWPVPQRRYA